MLKNQSLDRHTRIGRLRERLDQIVHEVADRELPRMDGGDLIGQQIVATIEALGQRNEEENRLLFDALRERARLYHESSGATVLEAAESLIAAHRVLADLPDPRREIRELAATARSIFEALLEVGSRRNAWACLEILMAEMVTTGSAAGADELLENYVRVTRDLIRDGRDDGVLTAVMKHSEWARSRAPQGFRQLADLLPLIIEQGINSLPTGAILRAYLYARGLTLPIGPELIEAVVRRLAAKERIDAEARVVYHDLLANEPSRREPLEPLFRELAYVNPGVDLGYDADSDSLNMLFAEYYPDSEWVWRNRALLVRRRGDLIGALAHLARAMSISGEPPEIMGMLAPVVAGLGFIQSAHQFGRFACPTTRERFHLDVLRLLDAHPSTDVGRLRLHERLKQVDGRPELPPEFHKLIHQRSGELLFEAGALAEASELYTAIFRDDLTDEIAAVRLAEIALRRGDRRRAENYIAARFSARVAPFVLDLRSRMAEEDGDLARATKLNAEALKALPDAQEAGRNDKDKTLSLLADRIRTIHGDSHVDCALLVMLQIETHAPPHADLIRLESHLGQRRFELEARGDDPVAATDAVVELARRDLADTDVFLAGIRKSLGGGDPDRALELIEMAESEGHGDGLTLKLMRGGIALRRGDTDEARTTLLAALEENDCVEGRHLLALVELEDGNEVAAAAQLALVASLADSETDERLLYRCHHLNGLLLERLGHSHEAYEAHLAAVQLFADWNESRRRAGLLALDQAFGASGALEDRILAYKALDLLDGFHDGEAVMRSAIARARMEENDDRAVAELEAALRRVNGRNLERIRRELLARLLAMGRTDDAANIADLLLENSDLPDREQLSRVRAAALRRRALDNLSKVTGRDPRAERAAFSALDEADQLDQAGKAEILGAILRFALAEGHKEPQLGRSPDSALSVAVALAGGQRRKDGSVRTSVRKAITECDDDVSLAARLVETLASGRARDILAIVEEVDQAALSLPWSRIELLRVVAAKALDENDRRTLENVLSRAPGRFNEICLYRDLVEASETDCGRLVTMIEDLRRQLGDRLRLPDERLRALRMRITEMRETPSAAWASSRLRVAGKRTRVYDGSALEYWNDRVADDETGTALHHVALMELAHAHELEADQRCSLDLWRQVHKTWAQLIEHNRFWSDLEWANDDEVHAAVSGVREQIGGWILLAQLRLAKRRLFAGDLPRAIEHARLVTSSPLMKCCNALRVSEALFEALSGDLERLLHKKRYDEAMTAIDHVIVADRENPHARREMVRVAGLALAPNLALVDSLSSPADPGMVAETCDLLGRILLVAENSIRELAREPVADPALAESLTVGLRALAYVARHRDDDVSAAAECLELAVTAADAVGISSASLRRKHSELGLEVVRRTIAETPTQAHEIVSDNDEGPFARALEEVDRLLQIDPDNVSVISQKAKLLLAADRDADAEALARDLFARAQKSNEVGCVRSAVELLHQVQSEREKLRYDSRMELIDRLMTQRNWRAALDLFRETTVGRESEAGHVLKHVDLLLGLRRFDKAELVLAQLADCEGMERPWRSRVARLEMVRAMTGRGGDALSAFELIERGENERAFTVVRELLSADDRDPLHHYMAAVCHLALGRPDQAADHARAARKNGRGHDWLRPMIEELEGAR